MSGSGGVSSNNQPFPNVTSQVVDSKGLITPPWRALFTALWTRSGFSGSSFFALISGSPTQVFQVADAVGPNYAVSLEQQATAIAVETTRAEAAEGTINGSVLAETTRAEGAEGTLQTNINTETSRAEAAEALLLPLAGGTMTGFPVLPASPTTALQAAPKQYVDAETTRATNAENARALLAGSTTQVFSVGPATLTTQAPEWGQVLAGFGVTWRDVHASRSVGTTYTNSLTRPIFVSVTLTDTVAGFMGSYVNGTAVSYANLVASQYATLLFVVPSGASYYVAISAGTATITFWNEL